MRRAAMLAVLLPLACQPVEQNAGASGVSGSIDIGGVEFRYVREGQGTPAVVIGSSVYYPRAFSENLRQDFDFVFADSRHFIPSYQPSPQELEALSLDTWADDLEALRAELGIDQWAVFGHSIHAQIALAYASHYPERISHLVLIGGVPYAGDDVGEASARLWADQASEARREQHARNREGLEEALEKAGPSQQFATRYIANAARYWADSTYDSTPLWEGVGTSPAFGRLSQAVPPQDSVREMLASFEFPTLVVLGKMDYGVPHTVWGPLVEDLPNVSLVLLENDSHNPMTEAPARFDPVLLDWIAR